MKALTPRQKQVLVFLQNYVTLYGYPPSMREICDHLGSSSTNGASDHLLALERKGFIARKRKAMRCITILKKVRVCRNCQGSGKVLRPLLGETEPTTCPTCHGSGKEKRNHR